MIYNIRKKETVAYHKRLLLIYKVYKSIHDDGSKSFRNTVIHHRLNSSSSPVLTATSLSYGKAKNSTPHRIKTPDPIKIKFGTVDYVGEGTRHAKFYANPSKGGFPANGWNIRKFFYSCTYTFFSETHLQVRPFGGFLRAMAQTTRSRARTGLLGVKKFEINI